MFNTSLNNGGSEKVGTIKAFGGSVAPFGWLICDGSAISRTLYAALFDVIGETYGAGDGTTTFNLPNFIGLTSDNVPCCGNGKTLGLSSGTQESGLAPRYAILDNSPYYFLGGLGNINSDVGTSAGGFNLTGTQNKYAGITTDSSKSGIVTSLNSASQKSLAIIKY